MKNFYNFKLIYSYDIQLICSYSIKLIYSYYIKLIYSEYLPTPSILCAIKCMKYFAFDSISCWDNGTLIKTSSSNKFVDPVLKPVFFLFFCFSFFVIHSKSLGNATFNVAGCYFRHIKIIQHRRLKWNKIREIKKEGKIDRDNDYLKGFERFISRASYQNQNQNQIEIQKCESEFKRNDASRNLMLKNLITYLDYDNKFNRFCFWENRPKMIAFKHCVRRLFYKQEFL